MPKSMIPWVEWYMTKFQWDETTMNADEIRETCELLSDGGLGQFTAGYFEEIWLSPDKETVYQIAVDQIEVLTVKARTYDSYLKSLGFTQ